MLIRTYSRLVFAHAYNILHQPEEAEDVVQESFFKAYQTRWQLRDPEKFPAWLFSIARNRALDIIRRRRTVPLPEDTEMIMDSHAEKPDQQLEGAELHEKIHTALSSLPDHHRIAITLRYLEGLDYHTIEEIMGLTNGALRGILGRALHTLRIALKPSLVSFEK